MIIFSLISSHHFSTGLLSSKSDSNKILQPENHFIINCSNDLLKNINVPYLDDTLEEVDFILSLGMKLKEEGKVRFSTPPHRKSENAEKRMSVLMSVNGQSSPKRSFLSTNLSLQRLSRLISPIETSEKSSITMFRGDFINKVCMRIFFIHLFSIFFLQNATSNSNSSSTYDTALDFQPSNAFI